MSVDFRVFYGYGYDIPNEKALNLSPEKFDELMDSKYTQILDGYSDEHRCFFGIILATVEGCTLYQIPVVDKIDHNELHKMLTEYRNIFGIKPNEIAHHYIGFAVT